MLEEEVESLIKDMHQGICGGHYECSNLNLIYLEKWKEKIKNLKAS
jgi:hypothetical protein